MKTKIAFAFVLTIALSLTGASLIMAQSAGGGSDRAPARPKGPCDLYVAAGDPCVAAHSTTRALYASYDGPLYQVVRQSDGKSLDIGVVQPIASPVPDAGGYADAAAQDAFCANTVCWITRIYDQSGKHSDLTQAPRGGFSGPALGGFNNVPVADMAPVTIMGHKVYGVFIEPGMGLRDDDPRGTAVDDQAEGQYWVINGHHFNSGCCFDYGNAEIDSRDDDNGTMETAYFGDSPNWFHGTMPGPWIMTDQENNLAGCVNPDGSKQCRLPSIEWRFVTAMAKGEPHHWTSMGGDAQQGALQVMFSGPRVNGTYDPMRKQGAILLGNGGDNSNRSQGTFYEGAVTAAGTFPADATDQQVQANIVAAGYGVFPVSVAPASETKNSTGAADIHTWVLAGDYGDFHKHDGRARGRHQVEPFCAGAVVCLGCGQLGNREDVRWPRGAGRKRERNVQGYVGAGRLQWRPGGQRVLDKPDKRQKAIRDDCREGAEREPGED